MASRVDQSSDGPARISQPPRATRIAQRPLQQMARAGQFCGRTFAGIPAARSYPSEVFRQVGILILRSGLVIWFMMFVVGCIVGLEGHYLLRSLGASGYVGLFSAYGNLKVAAPEMWGWIFSAKVGCGLVAEIGSMRINEEVDAMEVMGIDSRAYLISTRVLATWLATPFLFLAGLGLEYVATYLVSVVQLDTVSSGGYFSVFWSFQTPTELLFSLLWIMILGTITVLVGCYFGYTSTGGPVGVGRNTAKSMMVNMIFVSVIGMLAHQLFFSAGQAPISN